MKKDYEDDDGRTIADMSMLDTNSVISGLFSQRLSRNRKERRRERAEQEEILDKEQRRAYIHGAMGAALLIGLIFVAAAGLLIVFLLLIWGKL